MENIEILKTPDEVNRRIHVMGAEIADACGSTPLTMIVVMNGGLFFAASNTIYDKKLQQFIFT